MLSEKLKRLGKGNAALFAAAVGIRLLFLALYPRYDFLENRAYMGDASDFHAKALLMLGEDVEATPALTQVAPVYPAFLAAVYAVLGQSFVAVRAVQAVLGALTCLAVRRTGRLLWGPPAGLLSGCALALYYPHIQLCGYVATETLYTLLLCLAAVFLAGLREGRLLFRSLAGLVLWTLAAAIRPVAVAFLPALLGAFVYALWRRNVPAKLLLRASAALGCVCLLWLLSVFVTSGRTVPFVVQMGQLLYEGNSPNATGGHGGHFTWGDFQLPAGTGRIGEKETDRRLFALAIEYMKEHPFRCLSLAAKKTWNMWRPYHADASTAAKWIHALSYLPLCLGSAWTLFRYKDALFGKLFLAAPLCLGAALHAVLIGQIRYRYPLDPFLLLLAAPAGWTGLHKILRRAGLGRGRGTDRSEN